jgi:oligopeptide/dipeptide ABC transporter ATP-binding protein
VVPERGGEVGRRDILGGEPPDPTRIPAGCRFHPRCPEVASGRAASLGMEERNRTEIPKLREIRPSHFVACHLA